MARKEIIRQQEEDNAPRPARTMLALHEWKKLLKLVDNHTIRVDHGDEWEEWQELQHKLLEVVNGPGLFEGKV
jgi:hypothetical protein